MALSLRCECGQVEGTVEAGHAYTRASCYCRDCQAYARWLDKPGLTDAHGGTDIVAMNPQAVRITSGAERVSCMSLTDKGLLRWYASCCRTPLGNTPRDGNTAYVGLVAVALSPSKAVDDAFGPAGRTRINVKSAQGEVKPTPLAFVVDGLRIFGGIIGSKLRRQPPSLFFDANGQSIRTPEVLAESERASLYDRD
ncbi:MAG: hypothetical protein EOP92_29090 [Lysobacteraceae bacterium]|nr:MAG: hypothetical protein EOP92_29090 [Xanthomonadaceae bacterium]